MLRLHFKLEFWIRFLRFFSELNKERVVIILFREDFYSWSYKPSFKLIRLRTRPLIMEWATRNPQRQKECIEVRKNLKFGVNHFIPTIGSLPHWRTDCKTRTEKGRVNRWRTRTFLWLTFTSVGAKLGGTALKILKWWEFSHSLKMICVFSLTLNEKCLSYCQSTNIFL